MVVVLLDLCLDGGMRDGFAHCSVFLDLCLDGGMRDGSAHGSGFVLFLKIVVSWSTSRALAYEVRGWYFPDVLRTRRLGTGVLLGTYCR